MADERRHWAISSDLDGVHFRRLPPAQQGALQYLLKGEKVYHAKDVPPHIDRSLADNRMGLYEFVSLAIHKSRKLFDHSPITVEAWRESGADVYGNTGRHNRPVWIDMTWDSFRSASMAGNIKDIFFTPPKIHHSSSKIDGVRQLLQRYKYVTHIDDNPMHGLRIANYFNSEEWENRVNVVLVEDLTTGVMFDRIAAAYPNVVRVSMPRGDHPIILQQPV